MKWVRVCALVLLTLGVMRAGSWGIGWILAKLTPLPHIWAAAVSNFAGFACLVTFLYWDLMPGEPMDFSAVLFALGVFALYGVSDVYWRPWKSDHRT